MTTPFIYRAWVMASRMLMPVAGGMEMRKLRRAGLPRERAREKLGRPSLPRPEGGPLIWFHAASVGESLSVLALIGRMGVALPNAEFLLTSGTATSAELVAKRLPARTRHQFAPLDAPGPLKWFLRHWRPDAAIFVESELWPQMLRRTFENGARMAMVNARLSETSVARWQARPDLARYLLEVFDLILTQNASMAKAMRDMGAPSDRISEGMNLKALSDPLPVDQEALNTARAAIGDRPSWVASSTHPGEEREVLEAHRILLQDRPDLCLILVPRHPDRGAEVTALIAAEGMSFSRRSRGDLPAGQVFLADTMGELGIWYALSQIVFLGGSLSPTGGHNPFEVIQSDAAVLSGAHVAAFAETYAALEIGGAALLVADGEDLAAKVANWLDDAQALEAACAAGARFVGNQTHKLDAVSDRIIAALDLRRHD